MDPKEAEKLRKLYPNHMPLHVASKYLGVSPRQLSKLIADERPPFCAIGANELCETVCDSVYGCICIDLHPFCRF